MAVSSEQRRRARADRVEAQFSSGDVEAVLDLLQLADMAWHDCYGPREVEVPELVLEDVLLLAEGDLARLIRICRAAVLDFRDVRVAAGSERAKSR
ncbi:hypothetical protein [Amycolatopsis kentuckyensis]|uniref:hypothetical protein n=1 Tax=Amycolatopsis kentuckyensis TaxID=218823 RepID=UPI001178C88C|nr:hypothetical protein [Amycolatopsis kentuckyensis]